jgi:replication factor C subunit 3/5
MTDDAMDVDTPASAPAPPANAMSALMANAKGKGKANEGAATMSEADLKALNEKEGLPW